MQPLFLLSASKNIFNYKLKFVFRSLTTRSAVDVTKCICKRSTVNTNLQTFASKLKHGFVSTFSVLPDYDSS